MRNGNNRRTAFLLVLSLAAIFMAVGCQQAKYAMWEKLGKEKRHLLKDEVQNAAEEQKEASQQFESALSRIKAMYDFEGGELEDFYDELSADYERCREQADDVRKRIDNMDEIAEDLFAEWQEEAEEITNAEFRAKSKQSLRATQSRYKKLQTAMKKAEASMDPVLAKLKDYVLYLKHSLNAQAIGALKSEADAIDRDVSSLVADMNKSIREAETFLKEFE